MKTGVYEAICGWWHHEGPSERHRQPPPRDLEVALDDVSLRASPMPSAPSEPSGVRVAVPATPVVDEPSAIDVGSLVPAEDDWVAPRLDPAKAPSAAGRPSIPTPVVEARWIEVDEPLEDSEHARPTRRVRLARVLAATLARTGSDD